MKNNVIGLIGAGVILLLFLSLRSISIPQVWDLEKIENSILPYADGQRVTFMPDTMYYNMKERVVYKNYPVYVPGKEPEGYYEWLEQQEPEIVFDASKYRTDQDWIAAGESVFNSGTVLSAFDAKEIQKLKFEYDSLGVPATAEGVIPFYTIVIREKGKPEIGIRSCAFCHAKVMPDGNLVLGAQGNFPVDQVIAHNIQGDIFSSGEDEKSPVRKQFEAEAGIPGRDSEAIRAMRAASNHEFLKTISNAYPGVIHRTGTIWGQPTSVPDLFNLKQRKYLDHSGRIVNEGIEDLMLYATLADNMELMDKLDGKSMFPWPGEVEGVELPAASRRYSDAQLYALAMFISNLEAPENPNTISSADEKKARMLFAREGCVTCHPPPLYTNNTLTPAIGFEVPEALLEAYDVFQVSVETDPSLTTDSRRGTGFYKVPSLVGVWNRQALFHDGSITTLEELLNAERLEDDFIPSGYTPGWTPKKAVKGHPFGMEMTADEKQLLIKFLNSL